MSKTITGVIKRIGNGNKIEYYCSKCTSRIDDTITLATALSGSCVCQSCMSGLDTSVIRKAINSYISKEDD